VGGAVPTGHDVGVTEPRGEQQDPRKVRIGLAIITVVAIIAVGMFFVVDAAAGKAVMFAVAATAFVRVYLLFRWLRRSQAQPSE
jgi:hypothetical protein